MLRLPRRRIGSLLALTGVVLATGALVAPTVNAVDADSSCYARPGVGTRHNLLDYDIFWYFFGSFADADMADLSIWEGVTPIGGVTSWTEVANLADDVAADGALGSGLLLWTDNTATTGMWDLPYTGWPIRQPGVPTTPTGHTIEVGIAPESGSVAGTPGEWLCSSHHYSQPPQSAERTLDNGLLRFGRVESYVPPINPLADTVDESGMLAPPQYWSSEDDRWFKLTFGGGSTEGEGQNPMDFILGAGSCTNGPVAQPTYARPFNELGVSNPDSCWWHGNTALAASKGREGFPHFSGRERLGDLTMENYSASFDIVDGVGVVTVSGEVDVKASAAARGDTAYDASFGNDTTYRFRIEQVFENVVGEYFLRGRTTVTNISTRNGEPIAAPNVNAWMGTQDDYLAGEDRSQKTRGTLSPDGFTPLASGSDRANAVLVRAADAFAIFYTLTDEAETQFGGYSEPWKEGQATPPEQSGLYKSQCYFPPDRPLDSVSCYDKVFDGAYYVVHRAGRLAPGASTTFDWYYGGGPIDQLEGITEAIASDAVAEPTTIEITSVSPIPSVVGQPYTVSGTVTVENPTASGVGTVTVTGGGDSCTGVELTPTSTDGVWAFTCTLEVMAAGPVTLEVVYSGSEGLGGGTSSASVTEEVVVGPTLPATGGVDLAMLLIALFMVLGGLALVRPARDRR